MARLSFEQAVNMMKEQGFELKSNATAEGKRYVFVKDGKHYGFENGRAVVKFVREGMKDVLQFRVGAIVDTPKEAKERPETKPGDVITYRLNPEDIKAIREGRACLVKKLPDIARVG